MRIRILIVYVTTDTPREMTHVDIDRVLDHSTLMANANEYHAVHTAALEAGESYTEQQALHKAFTDLTEADYRLGLASDIFGNPPPLSVSETTLSCGTQPTSSVELSVVR